MTLARLAARHGVATEYSPSAGVTVAVPDAAVVAVLGALGVDATTPEAVATALDAVERADRERLLPPTLVRRRDEGPARPPEGLPPGTRLRVTTEEGAVLTGQDWERLPLGVHTVEAQAPDGRAATSTLIVSPARVPGPGRRTYGLLVQLYSLLSTRSWGMGDLGDLRELVTWAGRTHGAGFVQVNPLHAGVPGVPSDPSPYRPSSRRFPDPVHLRIEAVPEYAHVDPGHREGLDRILAEAAELRERVLGKGALIDRDAVWELKRRALEIVVGSVELGPGRRADYHHFLAERGRALEDHATYQALAERHGPHWRGWPEELREPRSAERVVRADPALAARVDFHCRLAWLTDRQLAGAAEAAREAGMEIGIVHDLAVGVHPEGSDAWAQQEAFAVGMSVGAPPDAFNARGQDWGLPPWRPDALAAAGYAPYRGLLRELLRHAGALRIDHVMGLFRLWWVPEGSEPTEGTYVRYDAEAMLAVLALEAHRAGALVIGEDLGTVEPGVREELSRRGVFGTSVLWFERDWAGGGRPVPPEEWRAECVATATTHDLPSTAARLSGDHIALRHRLGLLDGDPAHDRAVDAAETAEWLGLFERLGLLPEGPGDEEAEIRAVHRFLLGTPARMVGVWLPDAVGDRRPQNLPGTWDEYPNWRLPVAGPDGQPLTLERLASSPRAHALLRELHDRTDPEGGSGNARTDPGNARTVPPGARSV
ncbi:4-alpha-glucanotransferase [Streptomyces sp. NBC_00094]|uniref:4-alpha-glucanotransferase n=1 Tax=Streptomyces sp. NBC_00094 TaxID=2903620 RepID=UPI00225878D6|nr:4-alpha-glucanotransferase [Streptomyces sp. NBC_00094]MCX5390742.1 4-alpha-glucanotransferase [Streptomyces sp. NBC_00094]